MVTLHVQRSAILDTGFTERQLSTQAEYIKWLEKARAEGYAAGQREMRERAAMLMGGYLLAERIRALPIIEGPKEGDK